MHASCPDIYSFWTLAPYFHHSGCLFSSDSLANHLQAPKKKGKAAVEDEEEAMEEKPSGVAAGLQQQELAAVLSNVLGLFAMCLGSLATSPLTLGTPYDHAIDTPPPSLP